MLIRFRVEDLTAHQKKIRREGEAQATSGGGLKLGVTKKEGKICVTA